jgi:hypothetical protein
MVLLARNQFHAAAYQPTSLLPQLVADLQADSVLLGLARDELVRLNEVIAARGAAADHISTTTQACLAEALRQVDAAGPSEIRVREFPP